MRLLFCIALMTVAAAAAPSKTPAFPTDPVTPQERAQRDKIWAAVCADESTSMDCEKCNPIPGIARIGHFLEPNSIDAIIEFGGCTLPSTHSGGGFLLTKKGGKWEVIDMILGFDIEECHRMRFTSGREFLVCQNEGGASEYEEHSVFAIFGKGKTLGFKHLVVAQDDRRLCLSSSTENTRLLRAERIDQVTFHDHEGSDQVDVSILVSRGRLRMNAAQAAKCEDAVYERPGGRMPQPAWKQYQIDYLFDGKKFNLSPASEAAAKLFAHPN